MSADRFAGVLGAVRGDGNSLEPASRRFADSQSGELAAQLRVMYDHRGTAAYAPMRRGTAANLTDRVGGILRPPADEFAAWLHVPLTYQMHSSCALAAHDTMHAALSSAELDIDALVAGNNAADGFELDPAARLDVAPLIGPDALRHPDAALSLMTVGACAYRHRLATELTGHFARMGTRAALRVLLNESDLGRLHERLRRYYPTADIDTLLPAPALTKHLRAAAAYRVKLPWEPRRPNATWLSSNLCETALAQAAQ